MKPWEVWDLEADLLRKEMGFGRHISLQKAVASLIEESDKTIFDVGCGHGYLSKFVENKEYLGCDSSKEMLRVAKELFPTRKFIYGDIFDLSKFKVKDCVVCIDVLIHLPEIKQPLQQLWNCTGNTLLFTLKLNPKKKETIKISHNRIGNENLVFPPNKYLIIRWDKIEEIEKLINNLDQIKDVTHLPYDNRTEIFKIRRKNK